MGHRGNKSSEAAVALRQQKIIDMLNQGMSQVQIAEELNVDRITVWRNLSELRKTLSVKNAEELAEYRNAQLAVLELIEEALLLNKIDATTAGEWRKIRAEVAKLLGLNAPSRSLIAHVNSKDFVATLSDAELEEIIKAGRELPEGSGPVLEGEEASHED
jgi:DNA-binding CsgD family transcriptional regulator